ncbi:MAG: hypothetical protein AB7T31_14305 [Gemmatimonadales bacterium]
MKNPEQREREAYRRPYEPITFEPFPSGGSRFVTAGFDDLDHALDATRDLEERSYGRDRISVFMATETRSRYIDTHPRYGELESNAIVVEDVELEKRSKAAEGAGVGGAVGGALGAAGAAVVAVGTTLVIPPLGIALAGPLAAALAGLGAGALTGGLVGALVGSGMSEYHARHFEEMMKEGDIVVGVSADTEPERRNVLEILEKHGGDTGPRETEGRDRGI